MVYQTGVDEQEYAMAAEQFTGDSPSYREAMRGHEADDWRKAMEAEKENLQTHAAYEEIPEDSLISWQVRNRRAEHQRW